MFFSNAAVKARDCFPWDGQVVWEGFDVHDGSRDHTWPYTAEVEEKKVWFGFISSVLLSLSTGLGRPIYLFTAYSTFVRRKER